MKKAEIITDSPFADEEGKLTGVMGKHSWNMIRLRWKGQQE